MRSRSGGAFYPYDAANAAWVKLHINGQFKGVLVNVEQRDAQFLRNHGYNKEGSTWLYKVDGSSMLEVGLDHSPTHRHLCYPPFNSGPGKGGGGGGCAQPDPAGGAGHPACWRALVWRGDGGASPRPCSSISVGQRRFPLVVVVVRS